MDVSLVFPPMLRRRAGVVKRNLFLLGFAFVDGRMKKNGLIQE
jgi:hypothetical protein